MSRTRKIQVSVRTELEVTTEVSMPASIIDKESWVGLHHDEIVAAVRKAMKKAFEEEWIENAVTELVND